MSRRSFFAASLLLAGCAQAPSVEILGSFFPAWLLSLLLGVVLTFGIRPLLVRKDLEKDVGPLVLFYPCLVLVITGVTWLFLFDR